MVYWILILIYISIQFVLSGWFFSFLLKKGKIPGVKFSADFAFFFFPFCLFFARNLHFIFEPSPQKDTLNFKSGRIFLFLNPFSIFSGRIRIYGLRLEDFHIFFINRIPSQEKIHLIPKKGKISISGILKNGSFDLEDRAKFPIYRLSLREISMRKFHLDPGFSIGLFFYAEEGRCKIGSGDLHTHLLGKDHGILRISGVTVGEFMNMEVLPILSKNVELATEFRHRDEKTEFRGVLGQSFLPEEAEKNPDLPKKNKIGFKFEIQHKEYQLPLDIGIRVLLSQLAKGTNLGGVVRESFGVIKTLLGEWIKQSPAQKEINSEISPNEGGESGQ